MSIAIFGRICRSRTSSSNDSSLNCKWIFRLFHIFGIHFYREPNLSDRLCCERYFGRVSLFPDLLLGAFNFAALLLHLFVGTFPFIFRSLFADLSGPQTATLAQELFESFLPCFCLSILFLNGSQFHNLFHYLESTSLKDDSCRTRFRRWKCAFLVSELLVFFVVFVTAFFVVPELSFPSNSAIPFQSVTSPKDTTEFNASVLAKNHSVSAALFYYFDRTYVAVVSSALVLGSQIYIAVISLFIGYLFVENRERLRLARKTKATLTAFFEEYLQLTSLLAQAETCFNKLFLVLIITSVARIIFAFFLAVKSFSKIIDSHHTPKKCSHRSVIDATLIRETFEESDALDGTLILGEVESDAALAKPTLRAASVVVRFFELLTTSLMAFAFIIPGVFCAESSRSAAALLNDELLEGDAKELKDQILTKIHSTHGLSMGKFMYIDRTMIVTMVSISFTVSVVWLQMS